MREIRRVLKPGGIFRGQFNGLAHAGDPNTWSGVVFSADDIRAFTRENGLQLLNLDGEHTQYMWTTWRKPSFPLRHYQLRTTRAFAASPTPPPESRSSSNAAATQRYPSGSSIFPPIAISTISKCWSTACPAIRIYIGPPDSAGLQQVNAWLPEGVRTGLVPVELRLAANGGQPLCPPAMARVIPSGPLVPRIISITDGVNLVLENATSTGLLKVQLEEVSSPDSITASVDDLPVPRLGILCTDQRPPRYELNLELPEGLAPGPHKLQIRIGPRRLLPANIVVSS